MIAVAYPIAQAISCDSEDRDAQSSLQPHKQPLQWGSVPHNGAGMPQLLQWRRLGRVKARRDLRPLAPTGLSAALHQRQARSFSQ